MLHKIKNPLLGIFASLVLSLYPIVLSFVGSWIAEINGCSLGPTKPCLIVSMEVGQLLYGLLLMHWLAIITIPLGVIAVLGCTVWLLITLVRKTKT